MIYDTLKLSRALRTSFTAEQADTLASAFSESTEDNVATKADILMLKAEIAELRAESKTDVASVKTDIASVKTDIANVKTDIANVKTDIANLRTDMVRWIVTAIAFNFLGTIGLMVIVAKLAK